jgi:hypothetical protein
LAGRRQSAGKLQDLLEKIVTPIFLKKVVALGKFGVLLFLSH